MLYAANNPRLYFLPSAYRLLGDAMALTRFRVDIVQLERIEPEFAELIRLKGKVLYES